MNINNTQIFFINNSPKDSFFMSAVTPNVVQNLLSSLSDIKQQSIFLISSVKIASEPLSVPFTYIYNESISSGIVPEILKISRVTPVYTNGIISDTGNYRPIATLSPFSKVLERLV